MSITDEFTIAFYKWMLENDTEEHACEWFGYSDQDMLNYFRDSLTITK